MQSGAETKERTPVVAGKTTLTVPGDVLSARGRGRDLDGQETVVAEQHNARRVFAVAAEEAEVAPAPAGGAGAGGATPTRTPRPASASTPVGEAKRAQDGSPVTTPPKAAAPVPVGSDGQGSTVSTPTTEAKDDTPVRRTIAWP